MHVYVIWLILHTTAMQHRGLSRDSMAPITLTPYMVFPLFPTRFAAYAGGIIVSFIQPHIFYLI